MKLLAVDSVVINSPDISNVSNMSKFVLSNEKLLCKALLEAENGKVLREKLMPLVLEKYYEHFLRIYKLVNSTFPKLYQIITVMIRDSSFHGEQCVTIVQDQNMDDYSKAKQGKSSSVDKHSELPTSNCIPFRTTQMALQIYHQT